MVSLSGDVLGNVGFAKWTVTGEKQRWRKKSDPITLDRKHIQLTTLQEDAPVDVMIFTECFPPRDKEFWQSNQLKAIAWLTQHRSIGTYRDQTGWSIREQRVAHSAIGGVTNKTVWIGVAVKTGSRLCWIPLKRVVTNVLHQIVDPTVGGRLSARVSDYDEDTRNTAKGVLDWTNHFGYVKV